MHSLTCTVELLPLHCSLNLPYLGICKRRISSRDKGAKQGQLQRVKMQLTQEFPAKCREVHFVLVSLWILFCTNLEDMILFISWPKVSTFHLQLFTLYTLI